MKVVVAELKLFVDVVSLKRHAVEIHDCYNLS